MTNKIKTLEERTKSRLEEIEELMTKANSIINNPPWTQLQDHFSAVYNQNKILYEQNQIIIDYLQNIYENQSEVKK